MATVGGSSPCEFIFDIAGLKYHRTFVIRTLIALA